MCDRTEHHVGISGLFGNRTAMELVQEADCVIAVGASLNHYTTEHGYLVVVDVCTVLGKLSAGMSTCLIVLPDFFPQAL